MVRLLAVAAVMAVLHPALAAAQGQRYDKAYLLADTGDYLWWSVDPADEGADLRLVERRCPELPWGPGSKPCLIGAAGPETRTYSLWFHQRARVDEPITWSAANPLKFRFALVVDPPVPDPVVRMTYTNDSAFLLSAPATQVTPGVWEGTMTEPGALLPGERGQLGLRVSYTGAGAAMLRLRTDGSSWVAIPQAVAARPLRELQHASPDAPAPQSLQTERKTFRFNDANWELHTFTGDLAQTRTFTASLTQPAAAVFGWVETGRGPGVQQLVRGGQPDTSPSGPYSRTQIVMDGAMLARGAGSDVMGDTATAMDVPAGLLDLVVETTGDAGSDTYKAYVLAVYGERTLQSFRTKFSIPSATVRTPVTATCPGTREAIPLTSAVSAFRIELDWDSILPNQRWVPRFSTPEGDYPCGEVGTGDALTLVNMPQGAFWFAATPSKDSLMASQGDTVIDAQIRLWYQPPPAG